jgi:hypothetical protein
LRRGNLVDHIGGRPQPVMIELDGTKGYMTDDARKRETVGDELQMLRVYELMFNPGWAVPILLADKGVSLKLLKETTFDGKQVQVVEAPFGDKQSVTLFFDKTTGLPVKSAGKILYGSKPEVVFADWREAGQGADERALLDATVGVDRAKLLAYLRKQAPDPRKIEHAALLVKRLGDNSFDVREAAGADLVFLGVVALPVLRRALTDEDAEVARRAKDCLEMIVKRNSDVVLHAAIRQAVWGKIERVTEALLALLPNANEATVREVKAALAAIVERDGKPAPALVKALDDKEPSICTAARAVLGKDGGKYLQEPGRRLYLRGPKVPMKIQVLEGGTAVGAVDVVDVQLFNKLDPKLFGKP